MSLISDADNKERNKYISDDEKLVKGFHEAFGLNRRVHEDSDDLGL